ncbi:MAG: hypothetical protein CEE43_11975 [Promethearchaeota archaeon Loki_b32]|nr:MAG: hypothetical protein CEE43_11975 [Candidatus Lokiarchaeota archaeon Loki_b32]
MVFFNKVFSSIPGYVFGFLTFLIGILGYIVALILSPEYVMWEKSISILANHHPGGIYLRIGLIISNIIAIPFIIYIGRALKDENVNEILRKLTIGHGISVSVVAILTGSVVCANILMKYLHGLFALTSWIGGTVACLLIGLLMLRNTKFTKSIMIFSFIVALIFGTYLIPFFITNFCNYYPEI